MQFLDKVNNETPVLTSNILNLSRTVARKYASNIMDVLRFALPSAVSSVKNVSLSYSEPKPSNNETIKHYPQSYFESLKKVKPHTSSGPTSRN